jgi:putative transmembrane protein PGPGW
MFASRSDGLRHRVVGLTTVPAVSRDPEQILGRISERRARHRARPLAIRALVVLAGAVIAVPGAILTIVFPEAGIPLLVVALRLLALEYDWAARALGWLIIQWERIRGWLRRQSRVAHLLMASAAIAIGAVIVLLLV